MKPFRLINLIIVFIITMSVLGILLYYRTPEKVSLPPQDASSSVSLQSAAASSAENTYDPLKDPDNEESPLYKSAEEESRHNVEKAKAIAEAFVFKGVPNDYVDYCSKDAGFCFSYPPSWGKLTGGFYNECTGRNDLIGFEGKFYSKDDNYFFGATAYTYAAQECKTDGRGFGPLDNLPQMSLEKADALIQTKDGVDVALWYGSEVGWLTHEYDMVFTAPTSHPLLKRIAFIGPLSSSPDLSAKEIEEFLIVAHSYRTTSQELSSED